jgi:hypothetical protein
MSNMYYQLWVDALVNSKSYKRDKSIGKKNVFWILTVMNGLNLAFIFLWLDYFSIFSWKFTIHYTTNSLLENMMEGFIKYISPFWLINYFAIIHKNRYLKLINKYHHYNGKLAFYYSITSLALIVITAILIW